MILIVGLSGAAIMAAFAGARRTTTSFSRFVRDSREPETYVFMPDRATADAVHGVMRQQLAADAVDEILMFAAAPVGFDSEQEVQIAGGLDDTIGRTFGVAKIVAGRLPARRTR